jgi:hypothetical protein
MTSIKTVFVVAAVLCLTVSAERFVAVKQGHRDFKVLRERDGKLPTFAQRGVAAEMDYQPTMLQIGWDVMYLTTNSKMSDDDQAYSAGYIEGTHTFVSAMNHLENNYPADKPWPLDAENFLLKHATWLEATIAAKKASGLDAYWTHVSLMWEQWTGLFAGLNAGNGAGVHNGVTFKNFTKGQLLVLTSLGDLFDIIPGLKANNMSSEHKYNKYDDGKGGDWRKMPKEEFMTWFAKKGHCTSLFKLTGDMQDIFFGHVSWNEMNTMMRIFKHVTLNFNAAGTTAKTISMSSYPGMLSSFDDYYVTDSGLGVIETSLEVINLDMYKGNISPDLLLYWMRVMVANRMAVSAPDWAAKLDTLNSGTYNNQWMILDMNLFTPGEALKDNTMWVAEQMPGVVASKDVTEFLRYGYYPSYNVPMNKTLFVESGYAEAVKTQGSEMNSYEMCVRAQIFRRDQGTVTDLKSYKHMMHYNDYMQDPISNKNPLYAISSRADLNPREPQCFGAVDAKVSSYSMWKAGQVIEAFSGPTPQQPRFGYNITNAKCGSVKGLPTLYDFPFITMKP